MMKAKNDDVFLMNDELFLIGGFSFFDGRIIDKSSAIFFPARFSKKRERKPLN